jgi:hypothetical protein
VYPVTWNIPVVEPRVEVPADKLEVKILKENTQYVGLKISM